MLCILFLHLYQWQLNHTREERMEDQLLQTLNVTEDKVVWKEEGREVTIDGAYFDLSSWSLENGIYTLTGVFDQEETQVNQMLEKQNGLSGYIISFLFFGQCFAALVIYFINFLIPSLIPKKRFPSGVQYKYLFLRRIIRPPRFVFQIQ